MTWGAVNSIVTVRGLLPFSNLGFCHMHDHLFVMDDPMLRLKPETIIDDFEKIYKEIMLFKQGGGNSIVDAQPVGCSRHAKWLVSVSEWLGKKMGTKLIISVRFGIGNPVVN